MAWKEENIHIHIHNDNKEVVCLLKEIRDLLKNNNGDEKLKQDILDTIAKMKSDIESTV